MIFYSFFGIPFKELRVSHFKPFDTTAVQAKTHARVLKKSALNTALKHDRLKDQQLRALLQD